MTQTPHSSYGRTDAEWDELAAAGFEFLTEQARIGRTTTYTELNAVLARRTGVRTFDFDLESERAAMGHLLFLIVERERPSSGHMISALVQYLNTNDAGRGFYTLAQQYGVLPVNASPEQRLTFWANEVAAIHEHYGHLPARP